MLLRLPPAECDRLVASDASITVRGGRIQPPPHVRLGAGHEEGAGLVHRVQPNEVHVAAIHHVDGARFRRQKMQGIDIGQFPVGDLDKARGIAAQVQQPGDLRKPVQTQVSGVRLHSADHKACQTGQRPGGALIDRRGVKSANCPPNPLASRGHLSRPLFLPAVDPRIQVNGAPWWIRTTDPQLRRLLLYPTELRAPKGKSVEPVRLSCRLCNPPRAQCQLSVTAAPVRPPRSAGHVR